ncbi:hypothetical protein BS47DRAFT_858447 [Hydnum rufescens UP504]|uniref:Uncharacterized protein n=1 Tax=Hydnum rufescens UP504 TaxID=1448309 RepID=A0A9P6DUS6_9AGAM|nr:hypothetical protein BS47DRAFT_858447 [Hydnum rufescens UP504]
MTRGTSDCGGRRDWNRRNSVQFLKAFVFFADPIRFDAIGIAELVQRGAFPCGSFGIFNHSVSASSHCLLVNENLHARCADAGLDRGLERRKKCYLGAQNALLMSPNVVDMSHPTVVAHGARLQKMEGALWLYQHFNNSMENQAKQRHSPPAVAGSSRRHVHFTLLVFDTA